MLLLSSSGSLGNVNYYVGHIYGKYADLARNNITELADLRAKKLRNKTNEIKVLRMQN